MKSILNGLDECPFFENQEGVLHIKAGDLTHHLVKFIHMNKEVADWTAFYMQPLTLIVHETEWLDGLCETGLEVMRLIRKRASHGRKTILIFGK